jgi:hypothetical protein
MLGGCSLGVGLAFAPPALAHRAQSVLSTVIWHAGSSILEVTHRFHAHDAELALEATTGLAPVDITQVKNQARLMLYIEAHFGLMDAGQKIDLSPLGAEFEGEALLMYQEVRLSAPPARLSIDNQLLRDVFEGQTNLVNVRLAQKTRTLIFSGKDGVKAAEGLL